MKFKILAILFMTFCSLLNLKVLAQTAPPLKKVLVKPFLFFGDDSSKIYLSVKLPKLILSGIEENSLLQYASLYDINSKEYLIKPFSYKKEVTDSLYSANYKRLIDSTKIDLFMEGEFHIIDHQFAVIITLNDNSNTIAEFESQLRPLKDLQTVIDSASTYLNFRVKNNAVKINRVSIENFKISQTGPYNTQNQNNRVESDFPSRYLSVNLKNTNTYLLLPFNDTSNTADLSITGRVRVGANGSCSISPIIYINKSDSIGLQIVNGYLNAKDRLLANTLKKIQSALDSVVIPENLSTLRSFVAQKKHSQDDYINSFNRAFKAGKLELAYFFADRLAEDFKTIKNKSDLLKSKVYIYQNNLSDAFNTLGNYIFNNKDDTEARYYLAVARLKNRNYNEAKKDFLQLTPNGDNLNDLYYQIGLCNYYLGFYKESIDYFAKQIEFYESAHKDIYLYMAYCNRSMKKWDDGLMNINKFYLSDTSINKTLVSNYFIDYAKDRLTAKDFDKAYQFYGKSYNLHPRRVSLIGQIKAATLNDDLEYHIKGLIKTGISSSIFEQKTIYQDIADIYNTTSLDSSFKFDNKRLRKSIDYTFVDLNINAKAITSSSTFLGVQYAKLNNIDSALFYYKKTNDPYSYLKIAELQLTNGNGGEAYETLTKLNTTYNLTQIQGVSKKLDAQTVLYYFYLIGCKIMKKENTNKEIDNMNVILNHYVEANDKLLINWSFSTYYVTVKNNKQLDPDIKRTLISLLCPLIKISANVTIPCVVN
jgi:hypothetical protein